jgi:hypothetical protein
MWNYPEISGKGELWSSAAKIFASEYHQLCSYFNPQILSKNNNVEQASSLSNFRDLPLLNQALAAKLTDKQQNNNQQLSSDNDTCQPRNSLRGETETKPNNNPQPNPELSSDNPPYQPHNSLPKETETKPEATDLSLFAQPHLEMNFKANKERQMNLTDTLKNKGHNNDNAQPNPELSSDNPPYQPHNSLPRETETKPENNNIIINLESADSLYHIPDQSITAIITDPPYYGTIQYAELSDFFYVWQRRSLGDIFPDIFWQELTDKDREAVANPSRFRNMGDSPDKLAKDDYEAKMALAWTESYRVLRDDGVLTVQFNHKDSGAWDTLAKALIDAGFEITASWAVSTENPQNLHQAKKNSVSSTVILVCRKRNPNAQQAWWDDLRAEVSNILDSPAYDPLAENYALNNPNFTRKSWAERMEENDILGIDLYLSAFGPALNVFSRSYPILDNIGEEVRPEVAFAEARKAIANYRFRKLVQTDTAGFDPLTQWYLLAWDAFKAREFPFDEARQLALAIGGFNIADLAKTHKIITSKGGSCTLLTPQQRLKKRAFTTNSQEFSQTYLIDALHAVISIYEEEGNLQQVRQFMQKTGLVGNDRFMKTLEVAFKVIPDKAKEKDTLVNLWLGVDEIKSKVLYQQGELNF